MDMCSCCVSFITASDEAREAATGAWWLEATAAATVFSLRIASVVYIEWDLKRSEMTVLRWSSLDGFSRRTRSYP